jgi:hypothetical protein
VSGWTALRRTTDLPWEGRLRGYTVQVYLWRGRRHVAARHPPQFTELCAPAESLAAGTRPAPAWVERHPL